MKTINNLGATYKERVEKAISRLQSGKDIDFADKHAMTVVSVDDVCRCRQDL